MKRYVYKLVADNGGAPCVPDETLSLAICKPIIRQCAEPGDWIYGFAGDALHASHPNNRLIYVAKITSIIDGREYYKLDGLYADRPDCIYQYSKASFFIRKDARYHEDGNALTRDLGDSRDSFPRARVLLSTEFRYFHRSGPEPKSGSSVRRVLDALTQGHRVNLDDQVQKELDDLASKAFSEASLTAHYEAGIKHCNCFEFDEDIATDNLNLLASQACGSRRK